MAIRGLLWLVTGLTLLLVTLCVVGTSGDPELDPDGEHVCSKQVRESVIIIQNVSRTCYRTEFTYPPCRGGSWYLFFPRRRGHRGRHFGGTWRKKRWEPDEDDSHDPTPSWWSPHGMPEHRDDADDDSMCCKRVSEVCWFRSQRCVTRTIPKYFCCQGYVPDGKGGCKLDIQCADKNGGCQHMCFHDDVKGHHCACFSGYKAVNETSCVDIDECAINNGGCNQECVNQPGNYYCRCKQGYELTTPHNCTEVNECAVGNGGCDHKCINEKRSFFCECDPGFRLENGSRCIDVDECETKNGGCSHLCVNEFGGHSCECPEGLKLDMSGFTCVEEEFIPAVTRPIGVQPGAEPRVVGSVGEVMSRPETYGSIIGALILIILIILLVLCCRRYCRTPLAAAATAAPIVIVTKKDKKKKMMLGAGAELGEKPPMEYDADVLDSDMFDDKEKDGNLYTPGPSLAPYTIDVPPPYTEASPDQAPAPYEDVLPPTAYETPSKSEPHHVYANLAYVGENKTNAARDGSNGQGVYENVKFKPQEPLAEAIKKLRPTGKLTKDGN